MPSVALSACEDNISATVYLQRPCKATSTDGGRLNQSIGVGPSESQRSSMILPQSPRTKSALYLASLPNQHSSKSSVWATPTNPSPTMQPDSRKQPTDNKVILPNTRPALGQRANTTHELCHSGSMDNILRTWQCLESKRIKRLGLPPERHSEHYGIFRKYNYHRADEVQPSTDTPRTDRLDSNQLGVVGKSLRNEFAPFNTFGKGTCGYHFSRKVDHRKPKLGINYVDTVKWRSQEKD